MKRLLATEYTNANGDYLTVHIDDREYDFFKDIAAAQKEFFKRYKTNRKVGKNPTVRAVSVYTIKNGEDKFYVKIVLLGIDDEQVMIKDFDENFEFSQVETFIDPFTAFKVDLVN